VSELRGSIDVLQLDVFVELSADCWEQSLPQTQGSLFGSDAASLEHKVVILDDTVMRESTHWGDVLLGQIGFGGCVVLGSVSFSLAYSVDSLVALGSVMVSALSSSWDPEGYLTWMPRSDTTDLSQTSMSLPWELPDTPSLCNSGETLTLCNSDDVDNIKLLEDLVDLEVLFELRLDEADLLVDASTVDLNLQNVGLLGSEVSLHVNLGVADSSDGSAELPDSLLSDFLLVLVVDVLCESLLLGCVPVLVESSLELLDRELAQTVPKALIPLVVSMYPT